jgi:hypothetical protein
MWSSSLVVGMLGTTLAAVPLQSQVYESIMADMRDRDYAHVRERLLSAAQSMPAELYGFRAVPEIRSFGEELTHATAANNRLCRQAAPDSGSAGQNRSAQASSPSGKEEILGQLQRSLELCDATLKQLNDESARKATFGPHIRASHVVAMLGHNWAVYGKLTIMMRLKGLAPPPERAPRR